MLASKQTGLVAAESFMCKHWNKCAIRRHSSHIFYFVLQPVRNFSFVYSLTFTVFIAFCNFFGKRKNNYYSSQLLSPFYFPHSALGEGKGKSGYYGQHSLPLIWRIFCIKFCWLSNDIYTVITKVLKNSKVPNKLTGFIHICIFVASSIFFYCGKYIDSNKENVKRQTISVQFSVLSVFLLLARCRNTLLGTKTV